MEQMSVGHAPTVFLSAATLDLLELRTLLHSAFVHTQFRVLTQNHSLGASLGDVKRLITDAIDQSDCIIHLAGMGYGAHAVNPFFSPPGKIPFQCSWTQFEYYYAHSTGKDVIAFVCASGLSRPGYEVDEKGGPGELALKARLQMEHRDRVESGKFDDTPLAGKPRTLNERTVTTVQDLMRTMMAAVAKLARASHSTSINPYQANALGHELQMLLQNLQSAKTASPSLAELLELERTEGNPQHSNTDDWNKPL